MLRPSIKERIGGPQLPIRTMLFFCLALTAISSVDAQSQSDEHSILGVSIGSTLATAQEKLDKLGKRDGRDTRDGGRKESWAMSETDFAHVAVRSDKNGSIVWVSGFLRLGREVDFDKIGDPKSASGVTETQSIWNFKRPDGGYRLVAKGRAKKASVIYMLSLYSPPIE